MKRQIIKEYYDKSGELVIENLPYGKQLIELCTFLTRYDRAKNDKTSRILESVITKSSRAKARVIAKQNGIVAGVSEIKYFLDHASSCRVDPLKKDGDNVYPFESILTITGYPIEILQYERTILNMLQRMSGIATQTHAFIHKHNLSPFPRGKDGTYVAATRKTHWMWLDKKAVSIGTGLTHRLSLSDGILIKDNHIDLLKKFGKAKSRLEGFLFYIGRLKKQNQKMPFEIEVETFKEALFVHHTYVKYALKNPLILMLDNFSPQTAKKTIQIIQKMQNTASFPVLFELSGGINASSIADYAAIGADVVSLGSLTNCAVSLDISLQFV